LFGDFPDGVKHLTLDLKGMFHVKHQYLTKAQKAS
jgi:hypothetical protein